MYHIFCIPLSVSEHLCCCHVLAGINSAAKNIGVHVSFWISFHPFWILPRIGIAASCDSSIFSSLWNLHAILQSGSTNLCSFQQCRRVLFSPHPLKHLLFVDFLMVVILTSVRWYIFVVFICISLISRDIKHLFRWLLAICLIPLEKYLFWSSAQFLMRLFVLILSCMNCLCILKINPLSVALFANIFSQVHMLSI